MLVHRLRRWTNIKPTLAQRLELFEGCESNSYKHTVFEPEYCVSQYALNVIIRRHFVDVEIVRFTYRGHLILHKGHYKFKYYRVNCNFNFQYIVDCSSKQPQYAAEECHFHFNQL